MPTATARAGFARWGARTPDHRREATLLLLLVLQSGAAIAVVLGARTNTRTAPLISGWRVYVPRRVTHQQAAQQAGHDIYRLAVTERRL